MGYMGCGIHGVWHTWGVAYMGCGIHGVWHTWGVAYMGCGIHGVWHTWGVAYMGCGIHGGMVCICAWRVEIHGGWGYMGCGQGGWGYMARGGGGLLLPVPQLSDSPVQHTNMGNVQVQTYLFE